MDFVAHRDRDMCHDSPQPEHSDTQRTPTHGKHGICSSERMSEEIILQRWEDLPIPLRQSEGVYHSFRDVVRLRGPVPEHTRKCPLSMSEASDM
jgi:hypothetical protein